MLGPVAGQADPSATTFERSIEPIDKVTNDAKFGLRNGSVIVAPVPFSDPMIGSGLALGAGYLFQSDANSSTSVVGLGYLRSDNGSEAMGLSFHLAFSDNRWGFSGTYVDADINYDLVTRLGTLPISQTGKVAKLAFTYGFNPNVSIGLITRYLETTISSKDPIFPMLPGKFRPDNNFTTLSYGVVLKSDQRDNDLYPTAGSRASLTVMYNQPQQSNSSDYAKGFLVYDRYYNVGKKGVIAMRFSGCSASGNTPFYDRCSVGGTDAFRGYNVTRFLDNAMASAQVEYRGRISKRLGYVAFAGVGAVGGGFNDLSDSGTAGGIGMRYRLSKKIPVDFAVDGSFNDEGDSLLYISVGQRF